MKRIMFCMVAIIFYCEVCVAAEPISKLESVSQPYSEGTQFSELQTADVRAMSKLLEKSYFAPINDQIGAATLLGVDQIFGRFEDEKFIYFKMNMTPTDKSQLGELFVTGNDYLYHGMTPNGLPYAMYFVNFKEAELGGLIYYLENLRGGNRQSASVWNQLLDSVLPIAMAGGKDHKEVRTEGPFQTIQRSGEGKESNPPKQMIPLQSGMPMEPDDRTFAQKAYLAMVRAVCETLLGGFQATVVPAYKAVKTIVEGTGKFIANRFQNLNYLLKGQFGNFWNGVKETGRRVWSGTKKVLKSGWDLVNGKTIGRYIGRTNDKIHEWIHSKGPTEKIMDIFYYAGAFTASYLAGKAAAPFVKKAAKFVQKKVNMETPAAIREVKKGWDKIDGKLEWRISESGKHYLKAAGAAVVVEEILERVIEDKNLCRPITQ